ncbi:hypothetical protein B0H14DRAFT_3145167 [Mycena olivaceomarginata]|nr:hypothetical protein B0H14DRAFT_3145167 [Mycena olivaceomarginata]
MNSHCGVSYNRSPCHTIFRSRRTVSAVGERIAHSTKFIAILVEKAVEPLAPIRQARFKGGDGMSAAAKKGPRTDETAQSVKPADMNSVALNWVQGTDLDHPDAKQGRVPLNFKSTRKGAISCFNIVAPLYQNSPPMPIREPNLAIGQAGHEPTPHRPWNAWSSGRVDALLPMAEYVISILVIISEAEVPAMVSLSFTGGATLHLAFGSTINANQLVSRTPGSLKECLRGLREKDLRQFNPDIAFWSASLAQGRGLQLDHCAEVLAFVQIHAQGINAETIEYNMTNYFTAYLDAHLAQRKGFKVPGQLMCLERHSWTHLREPNRF